MTSHEISAELSKLALELNERRKDSILMERLRTAQADVANISKRMDELAAKLVDARNKEDSDFRNKRFKDVDISADYGQGHSSIVNGLPNPLRSQYTINYKVATGADPKTEAGWSPRSIRGFHSLDADITRFILDVAPHALPAEIAALAPGKPHDALSRYFIAHQRGYLS